MNTEAIMPQTSDFKKNLNINIDLRGWPCIVVQLSRHKFNLFIMNRYM